VVSAIGPVAVIICIDDSIWAYSGGVYKVDKCCTAVHHAVTIVGYGHDKLSGLDYWIVKNSWGPDWGLGGYIWWAMGTNQCIIETYIDWPTVRSLTGPCP
jgi:C1A family cysteine protease